MLILTYSGFVYSALPNAQIASVMIGKKSPKIQNPVPLPKFLYFFQFVAVAAIIVMMLNSIPSAPSINIQRIPGTMIARDTSAFPHTHSHNIQLQ